MATAAEKKAIKEAEEAAAAQAAADLAAAEAAAAEEAVKAEAEAQAAADAAAAELAAAEAAAAEQSANDADETPSDETPNEEPAEDAGEAAEEEPAVDAGPVITEEEDALAKQAAFRGVAVSPLAAPIEPAENPAAVDSDPNIPEGLNLVVESYGNRGGNAYLAAEDGQAIDLDTLFLGPDVAGQFTSTVRIVEHSHLEPYGHEVTTLVVGAGSPVNLHAASAIVNRLKAQYAESAADDEAPEPAEA